MLKNYLEYLALASKKFAREHRIFDVVVYGSFIRGKQEPNDIDIALIFSDIKLNERLIIAQKFKETIKRKIKNPDIKTINISELFDRNFLARQGIFVEGYSLLHEKPFSKAMGFTGYFLFTYNLKNLNHNKKTSFTYCLIGRNKEGIIKLSEAIALGKGVFIVPAEKSEIFEDFLKEWAVNYKVKKILISEI